MRISFTAWRVQAFPVLLLAVLAVSGCGGGGPILQEPTVSQSSVQSARSTLTTHRLAPSRNTPNGEMHAILQRVWERVNLPIYVACTQTFSSGCDEAVRNMRLQIVADESVNAYADARTFTIGVHRGLLRSVGSDDELAWVIAHEAAHLLFGHTHKKMGNATNAQLMTGALAIALGAATRSPDILNSAGDWSMEGYTVGYVSYSPEMETEADQFAAYVLNHAGMRPEATLDMIVRLHRGEVPAPVRRGDGWAGLLQTHPANDYRLAAMRETINDIRNGAVRPLSKAEHEAQERQKIARQTEARRRAIFESAECVALRREYPDCKWWQREYDWLYITRCPSPFGHACQ